MLSFANDYLEAFSEEILSQEILQQREFFKDKFLSQNFQELRKPFEQGILKQSNFFEVQNGVVKIGKKDEITKEEKEILCKQLEVFIPWRKGPFEIFGIEIDAEWRSDFKWQRIISFLENVQDGKVADVGCNNGYFLFRLAEHSPKLAIGFDPTYRFRQNFIFLKEHTKLQNLFFELLGFEHLLFYPNFFDIVLNLGVLYHHSDPLLVLKNSYVALKKGGQIVVDSLYIESSEYIALYPPARYAGMKNIHFIPSVPTLKAMMTKAGFRDIQEIYRGKVTFDEQRKTKWAPCKSLLDIQNSENKSLTVEGFPMPARCYVIGRK